MTKYKVTIESEFQHIIEQHMRGPMYHAVFADIQKRVFTAVRLDSYDQETKTIINEIDSGTDVDGNSRNGSSQELIEELEGIFLDILSKNRIKF